VAADRLDEAKIELLRQWGAGLAASGRDEELRAAGRAIVLLVDETDALQRDVWHERARVSGELPEGEPAEPLHQSAEQQVAETPDQLLLVDILNARLATEFPSPP
jgi:hypothetical protein